MDGGSRLDARPIGATFLADSSFAFGDSQSVVPVYRVIMKNLLSDYIVCQAQFAHTYPAPLNGAAAWVASFALNARLSTLRNNANQAMLYQTQVNLSSVWNAAPVSSQLTFVVRAASDHAGGRGTYSHVQSLPHSRTPALTPSRSATVVFCSRCLPTPGSRPFSWPVLICLPAL